MKESLRFFTANKEVDTKDSRTTQQKRAKCQLYCAVTSQANVANLQAAHIRIRRGSGERKWATKAILGEQDDEAAKTLSAKEV